MIISVLANCVMFSFELLQMKQSGTEYFSSIYNIFDCSMFVIYSVYFGLRMYNPISMLVGTKDKTESDIEVTTLLMVTIVFNVFIML